MSSSHRLGRHIWRAAAATTARYNRTAGSGPAIWQDRAMENAPHLLVVDDHRDIREPLARYLGKHGFRVSTAENAAAARKILQAAAIDLLVLDIMMPGEDGLALCRELRARGDLPIVLLTALGEDTDRIVGLEMGADDYVAKPFNPRELVARIKAVLRRAQALPPRRGRPAAERFKFDRWILDVGRRELTREDGVVVPLSTGEFLLLTAFLEHPKMVLSRDQLLDLTRGREAAPFDRAIDNQVLRLRRKIERDPKKPELIRTHWGGGYSFEAEVERA
jgi:two-component system OmpR family response regulator